MADRTLTVRIVGDDKSLNQAFTRSQRKTQQFEASTVSVGKNITRAFGAAGIAIGGAAVFTEVQRSISAASDLNEQISKSRQVFRDASKEVEDWSKTTAQSMGISQRAALTAAGTFGNLFNTVHIGQKESADMSKALVQLAADLASFNNASPDEVLTALRSGLIGEAEPLRRFGVLLSETRVQQLALAETGKKNVKALTDQEKALARYHIILRDTASAQGDFARTSDGLANQQRKLAAQVEDLEASLGQVLIPTVTDLVSSLNDAVGAAQTLQGELGKLQAIGGIDIPINLPISIILKQGRGKDIKGGIQDLGKNIGEALNSAFGAGVQPFKDLLDRGRGGGGRGFTLFPSSPERERAPDKSPTKKIADDVEDAADKAAADAKRVKTARERQKRAFSAFTKGLGLKLDTAGLTETLTDDLAVLRELERAILRQIEREGRTFKLVQQLVTVRGQIAQTTADIAQSAADRAEDAKQKSQDAYDSLTDSLSLKVEIAQTTKSLADDQVALRALEQAILKRIASEGKTTDLMRQLSQVRQDQDDVAKQIAENARTRRQEKQFASLGLTEEGDKPTPGTGSLLKRAQSLQNQIKGTTLDTPKTRQQLARIVNTLKANFRTAGKEVRAAILGMLNDISGALDDKTGPLTKTTSLNSKKILDNLGLSPEQVRELRGRLSNFNSAGVGLPGASKTGTTGGFAGGGQSVVEAHFVLNIDGQKLAAGVTRGQQKWKRRNPTQKRGPNRR